MWNIVYSSHSFFASSDVSRRCVYSSSSSSSSLLKNPEKKKVKETSPQVAKANLGGPDLQLLKEKIILILLYLLHGSLPSSQWLFQDLLLFWKLVLRLLRHFFCFVTLRMVSKVPFFFIPALIGIVKLASVTIAFFLLLRVPWRLFRWLLGHGVNLWFFRVFVRISVLQIMCIPVGSIHFGG